MQFLKTLGWVLLAVVLAVWAVANWADVTLALWGRIEVDIKLPLLLALVFLAGLLPPLLVYRARLWRAQRRALALEHELAAARLSAGPPAAAAPPPHPPVADEEDVF